MISLYSLNAVTNAMKLCKQHNIQLGTDVDSPVDLLNRAVDPSRVFDTTITDEQFFQELPAITQLKRPTEATSEASVIRDGAIEPEALRVDDHETTLFELKNMAIQRCNGMLDFARNVVQPFVQLVIQNNVIDEVKPLVEDWNLIPVGIDSCVDSPVVQALIQEIANPMGNGTTYDPINFDVPTNIEIPETGVKAYDELVRSLLNDLNISIYDAAKLILAGNNTVPVASNAPMILKERVLVLLLSSYYIERPWPDSGVDALKWKAEMGRAYYTSIGWVYGFEKEILNRVATGNIIYSYDTDKKDVYICQETMDDYLSKGGIVEGLLGAIYLMDEGDYNVSARVPALLENQNAYVDAYNRRAIITQKKNEQDWVTRNRQSLKTAFSLAIDQLDQGYFDNGEDQRTREDVKRWVMASCDAFFSSADDDITLFIIQTACNDVFRVWEIAPLMRTIHQAMVDNQDPSQAATSWMIDYVLDWISGSVFVDKL